MGAHLGDAMVTPILNQSIETAGRGFFQSFSKSLDYIIGSDDVLVMVGIIFAIGIFMWAISKGRVK